jgi:FkbM family methyltransferase
MIAQLRRLRHGPLKLLNPAWILLGKIYRYVLRRLPVDLHVSSHIGPYGPFKLDGRFAFTNFAARGERKKNIGFCACIEHSVGATCVIDVGAQIGLVSLPMSTKMAPGGRVYSFEPAEFNRSLLERHVALNGIKNIEVIGCLVGKEDAEHVEFFELDSDTGLNSVVQRDGVNGLKRSLSRQVSLDSYCRQHNLEPQLIKIDVEGAEIDVLKGAAEIICACQPVIFLSVHPSLIKAQGYKLSDVSVVLEELGYQCRTVEGDPVEAYEATEYIVTAKEVNNINARKR